MSANPFTNPKSYYNLSRDYINKNKSLEKGELPIKLPSVLKAPHERKLLLEVIEALKKEDPNRQFYNQTDVRQVIQLTTKDEMTSNFLISDYMDLIKFFAIQNPDLNCEVITNPINLDSPNRDDLERAMEAEYSLSILYSNIHFVLLLTINEKHYVFDSLPKQIPKSKYSSLGEPVTILSPFQQSDESSCGPISLMTAKMLVLSSLPYNTKNHIDSLSNVDKNFNLSEVYFRFRINLFRDLLLRKLCLPDSFGFKDFPEMEKVNEEEEEDEEESPPPSRSPSRSPSPEPPPPPPKKEKKRKILPALERAKTLASISSPQGPKQPPKPKRGKKQAEPPVYLENVPTFPVRLNIPKFVAFEKDNGKFQVVPTTTKTGALTTRQKQKSIVITNDETKEPSVFVGRNDIYSNEFVPSSKKKAIEFYG